MITKENIYKIAKLAQLNICHQEIPVLTQEINKIIEIINVLNNINCNDIQPLTSTCNIDQRLRDDEVLHNDISNELFNNISCQNIKDIAIKNQCFIVPIIIE